MNTVQSGLRLLRYSTLDKPNLLMAGTVIAAVPIFCRSAGVPAPARARPHRRGGEGMNRRLIPIVASAASLIAACSGGGDSILESGNERHHDGRRGDHGPIDVHRR